MTIGLWIPFTADLTVGWRSLKTKVSNGECFSTYKNNKTLLKDFLNIKLAEVSHHISKISILFNVVCVCVCVCVCVMSLIHI